MADEQTPGAVDRIDNMRATLGSRIRKVRDTRKMTAKSLATASEVTPGFISQLENGMVMPSRRSYGSQPP